MGLRDAAWCKLLLEHLHLKADCRLRLVHEGTMSLLDKAKGKISGAADAAGAMVVKAPDKVNELLDEPDHTRRELQRLGLTVSDVRVGMGLILETGVTFTEVFLTSTRMRLRYRAASESSCAALLNHPAIRPITPLPKPVL